MPPDNAQYGARLVDHKGEEEEEKEEKEKMLFPTCISYLSEFFTWEYALQSWQS